jgi:GNAT superfamily N-acetyltransferase
MATFQPQPFESFAILTPRLIIFPTPVAISSKAYRALYSKLHADENFCQIAFGEHFKARNWSDDETREWIETRDIGRCWNPRGLGDFAVGLRESIGLDETISYASNISILKGSEFELLAGPNAGRLDQVEWVGYAGVRDATTTSLPKRGVTDPNLPPWYEMVELRYGLAPEFWGRAIAKEAAEAVMQWAVIERGTKRFIAETEKDNRQSARLLQKLGFVASGTDYWKEPSEVEWELVVR